MTFLARYRRRLELDRMLAPALNRRPPSWPAEHPWLCCAIILGSALLWVAAERRGISVGTQRTTHEILRSLPACPPEVQYGN